jgi:hypothetical protein
VEDAGCATPELLGDFQGTQLDSPAILNDRVFGLRVPLGVAPTDVVVFGDGGLEVLASVDGPAALCATGSTILALGRDQLAVIAPDGGKAVVQSFAAPPVGHDCDGLNLALSLPADGGNELVTYSPSGVEMNRTFIAGAFTSFGLAQGGWVSQNRILTHWDGLPIETTDVSNVEHAWRVGEGLAIRVDGRVLSWRNRSWAGFTEYVPMLREAALWNGSLLRVYLDENAYVFEEATARVFSWPQGANSTQLDLQLWSEDPCSGLAVASVRHDGRMTVLVKWHGSWSEFDVAGNSLLYARVAGDELEVATTSANTMRRSLTGGDWSRVNTSVPASALRVLPASRGLVMQLPTEIAFLRDDGEIETLAEAGRLLGVSNREVFWTRADVGVQTTLLAP